KDLSSVQTVYNTLISQLAARCKNKSSDPLIDKIQSAANSQNIISLKELCEEINISKHKDLNEVVEIFKEGFPELDIVDYAVANEISNTTTMESNPLSPNTI
ncbi:MAG: hypothetical protein HRT87_07290, partial [Legionellales bacterium]|nr:hypothetical protein [Legionellales bacterium]